MERRWSLFFLTNWPFGIALGGEKSRVNKPKSYRIKPHLIMVRVLALRLAHINCETWQVRNACEMEKGEGGRNGEDEDEEINRWSWQSLQSIVRMFINAYWVLNIESKIFISEEKLKIWPFFTSQRSSHNTCVLLVFLHCYFVSFFRALHARSRNEKGHCSATLLSNI